MKNLKYIFSLLTIATFTGCINSDNYDVPNLDGECTTLTATKTVQDVATVTTNSLQAINDVFPNSDDVIEAYVTSSDEGGNFYKSISMISLDGTKGFSMPIDGFSLYTQFEPGRKVFIKLKDRYIQNNTQTASMEIGSRYDNETPTVLTDDRVGRISGVEYRNVVLKSCVKVDESAIVNNFTVLQTKQNANINKLIEIDGVQFTDASLGKKYFDPTLNNFGGATNHEIADAAGNRIIVRFSEFCTFAGDNISPNSGKVRGVLTKFGSDFQLMVRTTQDIQLNTPRIVPVFEETFSNNNINNWSKQSVTGAQTWAEANFGIPAPCALMSGFAGGANNVNDDWLISPAINLSTATNAFFRFDNASRFSGNLLQVYVSTNYTSGLPSTATWTELTGFILDLNTASFVWTNSGNLNLNPYLGNNNVRIAFRYTSSASASRTWEVDNVKVFAQ